MAGQATTVFAERNDGQWITFLLSNGAWAPSLVANGTPVDIQLVQTSGSGPGSTWALVDQMDTVETYTELSSGVALLTAITARGGYTQTLSYNNSNQLVSVTDSYGRQLNFAYQGGLLSTLTTPDGLVVTYGYSPVTGNIRPPSVSPSITSRPLPAPLPRGRGGSEAPPIFASSAGYELASVSYSTNPPSTLQYLYENSSFPFALTGIIDEDGNRFATWTYDAAGRVLTSQHAGGADLTVVAYNDNDGSRTVTNPLGQQDIYKYTVFQGARFLTEVDRQASATTGAATQLLTYDSNGHLASKTDWNGNVTQYVNDTRGQPLQITEAAGTPQQRVTTINYLPNYHLPVQKVAPGLTTTFAYDASGNLLSKTLTDTTISGWQTRTWKYSWANFLPATTTDPRGDTTTYIYDSSGALVATTNPLGQVTQITNHLPGGLPTTIVDPNGTTTDLVYDPRQRLLTSTVYDVTPLTRSYSYDPAGNLIQKTLPDGSALAYTYDAAHRLVAIADLFHQVIQYTLDGLGDRTQTLVLNGTSTTTRQHSAAFDALGHLLQDIGGAGQVTNYAYDANGNRILIADPLGHVTEQIFDALNRLVTDVDPAGGVTRTAYDAQDHPVQVTDPNGNATNYIYDGFGDLLRQASPDSGMTNFSYDFAGNRIVRTDAAGAVTAWSYDALNRVVAATYPADPAENVAYTYDGGSFGVGHLTSLTDAAGNLTLTYNPLGLLTLAQRSLGGVTLDTGYVYDAANRIAAITYPSGLTANYRRDQMGRVTAIDLDTPSGRVRPGGTRPKPAMARLRAPALPSVVSGVSYLPFGPVNGLTYGNGIAESRSFDLDYRLTGISAAGSAPVENLGYGYDADNNVLSIADAVTAGNSQSFRYDPLNRLVSAAGGYGTVAYSWDPVGNLLTRNTTVNDATGSETFSYTAGTNHLMAVALNTVPSRQFAYSASGNRVSDQQANQLVLAYNQDNRLASAQLFCETGTSCMPTYFSGGHAYNYDAFGQRLVKTQTAPSGAVLAATAYQYDQAGHLLEEVGVTGANAGPGLDYVYLDGRPVATFAPATGALYFTHDDRLGTPQLVTGSQQGDDWQANYNPFGQTAALVNLVEQNLRFPGQYADAETGYYHNGFRDYDPSLGRYIESDPIGLGGGLNTYAYASENSISSTDPFGLANQNLFNPIFDYENWKIENDWNPPGQYSVAGHGNPDYMEGPWGQIITPSELAKRILSDPNYVPGETVILHSCSTGKGDYSFGYQLSYFLSAPVIAPTGDRFVDIHFTRFLGMKIPFLETVQYLGESIDNNGYMRSFNSFGRQ